MLMSGSHSSINLQSPSNEKVYQFSGLRPRPDYIPDPFSKHYSLFGSHFNNVSTNPAKYDPQRQEYDFHLDFSNVKGAKPSINRYRMGSNDNSLERDSNLGMGSRLYDSANLHSGAMT